MVVIPRALPVGWDMPPFQGSNHRYAVLARCNAETHGRASLRAMPSAHADPVGALLCVRPIIRADTQVCPYTDASAIILII
jgi:hypothetical protein